MAEPQQSILKEGEVSSYHYDWEEQCDIDFGPELSPTIVPEDDCVKESAIWYEELESLEGWMGFHQKQYDAFCLYEKEITAKIESFDPDDVDPVILRVYEEKLEWIIEYKDRIDVILCELAERHAEVKTQTDKWDDFWQFWERMEMLFDFISGKGFGLRVNEKNDDQMLTRVFKKKESHG